VYKLRKALYGLKQVPRAWYGRLTGFLFERGFEMGKVDQTLSLLRKGRDILIVQVYADGIVFGGSSNSLVASFAEDMSRQFEMSMMGELQFFLGLQIKQSKESERLGLLLDNRDDVLREAKKMRKELMALLEDARTRVPELETQNLDAKLEIDSLKASPVVSDEVECADCPVFLADLALFKEKHASKCEELDVLRVEVAELKSRPALLGACTSCPVLHGKIDEMHAYIVSLEAKLKEPIPTSCSTCELHALKNLEIAHYVDRLKDKND
jgi:hypothetical protein